MPRAALAIVGVLGLTACGESTPVPKFGPHINEEPVTVPYPPPPAKVEFESLLLWYPPPGFSSQPPSARERRRPTGARNPAAPRHPSC